MSTFGNAGLLRPSRRLLCIALLSTLAFVLVALPAQAQLVRSFAMQSPSMEPTIREGERILANPRHYRSNAPARGDVVIYRHPRRAEDWVKRIVALPGDRVAIRAGRLVVNGTAVDEPYIAPGSSGAFFNTMPEITVPDGHVFVLGDNRANSMDSRARQHGPVPIVNLQARATDIIVSRDLRRIGRWIGTPQR